MKINAIKEITQDIRALAETAKNEGHGNIQRLVQEYETGENRFLRDGEALFGAYANDQLVGIAGLNVDPYDSSEAVGRVRRLYVLPDARRSGVASKLVERIEVLAAQHFCRIQLFTASEEAAQFYTRLGYSPIDKHKVSHEKRLDT